MKLCEKERERDKMNYLTHKMSNVAHSTDTITIKEAATKLVIFCEKDREGENYLFDP